MFFKPIMLDMVPKMFFGTTVYKYFTYLFIFLHWGTCRYSYLHFEPGEDTRFHHLEELHQGVKQHVSWAWQEVPSTCNCCYVCMKNNKNNKNSILSLVHTRGSQGNRVENFSVCSHMHQIKEEEELLEQTLWSGKCVTFPRILAKSWLKSAKVVEISKWDDWSF